MGGYDTAAESSIQRSQPPSPTAKSPMLHYTASALATPEPPFLSRPVRAFNPTAVSGRLSGSPRYAVLRSAPPGMRSAEQPIEFSLRRLRRTNSAAAWSSKVARDPAWARRGTAVRIDGRYCHVGFAVPVVLRQAKSKACSSKFEHGLRGTVVTMALPPWIRLTT